MNSKARISSDSGDERKILSHIIPLDMPFTLNVFPTNVCNFRCNYCIQSVDKATLLHTHNLRMDTLRLSDFELIMKQAGEFEGQFKLLSFMGHGEPLCNSEIEKMVEMAKRTAKFDRIEIITNGSLLSHKRSLSLISAGLDGLRISLQGLTREQYMDTSQVDFDFQAFLEEISFFYEHRGSCKVYVKIPDTCLKDDEEKEFYRLFEKRADRMFIERIMPVYEGVSYAGLNNALITDRYGEAHKPRKVCPLCFYMLSVWPNGDVQPCDAFNRPCLLGNIHDDSLVKMWHSESLRAFRVDHLEFRKDRLEGCAACCAPDDVSRKQDELDGEAGEIIKRFR